MPYTRALGHTPFFSLSALAYLPCHTVEILVLEIALSLPGAALMSEFASYARYLK